MKSPQNWRFTTWIALGLVAVAGLGVALYQRQWLTDWMPGIVEGALTVAATITIVDAAIRADGKRQNAPRLLTVLGRLEFALSWVLACMWGGAPAIDGPDSCSVAE